MSVAETTDSTPTPPDLTIEELLALIRTRREFTNQNRRKQKPDEPPRYVIYVRKSTEDKEKQVDSLEQQEEACRKYAVTHGLEIIEPVVQEEKSAKRSERRPEFKAIIEELRKTKVRRFNSILTWHPDRLSRNMKDAGEIMDLLDDGIILDLKFATHTFKNDPSSRMTLGVMFVVAQNYSENLSVNVKRGTEAGIRKGKSAKMKHGYQKDEEGHQRPNGRNFDLVKQAFQMRLSGQPFQAIVEFLNGSNYQMVVGKPGHHRNKTFIWNPQNLTNLYQNSFYCGLLMHGDEAVDLTVKDLGFKPMITVSEYLKLNPVLLSVYDAQWQRSRKVQNRQHGLIVKLMYKKVICSYCNQPMETAATKKKGKGQAAYSVFYRCGQQTCPYITDVVANPKGFVQHSLPVRLLVHYAQQVLDTVDLVSLETYDQFIEMLKDVSEAQTKLLKVRSTTLKAKILALEGEKRDLAGNLRKARGAAAQRLANEQIEHELPGIESKIAELASELADVEGALKKIERVIPSYEQFRTQMGGMAEKFRKVRANGDVVRMDTILGGIFSNFLATGKQITAHKLVNLFERLPGANDQGWWTVLDSNQ